MTNRIGDYLGDLSERIERASITLGFCDVVVRLHIHSGNLSKQEREALAQLQVEAVRVFRDAKVPLPWERAESR